MSYEGDFKMIRRSIKKLAAIGLSVLMLSSFMVGCGSKGSDDKSVASNSSELKEVKLKMYLIGDKPADFDEVYAKVNEKMKEEINATLEVNFIPWSDMTTKYQLLFQSGEDFDLIFTAAGWGYYSQVATKNGFLELTDDLLKEYAPQIYANEPADAWNQAKIDGKVYMVPNDRNEYGTNVFAYRGDLASKYGFESITGYDELEAFMDAVAQGESGNGIKVMANGGGQNLQWPYMIERYGFSTVSGAPTPSIGYDVNDTSGEVFAFVDTPEYMEYVTKMKEFADKGYWAADSISSQATRDEDFVAGKTAIMTWNLSTVANRTVEMNAANPDWNATLLDLSEGVNRVVQPYTNNGIAINANSKNPERALMAIELLRYDEEINNLTWYGIEGEHWENSAEGEYTSLEGSDAFPAGEVCPWGWYTTKFARTSSTEPEIVQETITKWSDNYTVSNPLAAFSFDDSNVKNEMASVGNVITQYGVPLDLGMVDDVEAGVKEFREKLTQAGFDKILEECQKQATEFVKSYN